MKSSLKSDEKQAILTIDYQKNISFPDTKRNFEYYLRKLSVQTFCIYDEKTFKATLFTYAEHFAMKGANEVISCIDFYLKIFYQKKLKFYICLAITLSFKTRTNTYGVIYNN